jgi:hypothetical protein
VTGARDPVTDRALAGYRVGPWPGEDGGPRRSQAPHGVGGLGLRAGDELSVTTRAMFGPLMVVLRDPGEVFLLMNTLGPGTVSWLERIDPISLEPLDRSPDLPGGPWWPGGVAAHANGSLYVAHGRWCHRLDPGLTVVAARELPRDRPYNSLVVLADGHLVMKDIDIDRTGPSQLVVLEPDGLEIVASHDLPEGSIARLSADGDRVYVVGDTHTFRFGWDGSSLAEDRAWTSTYRTDEGQGFGWDIVVEAGSGWFLDDGEGTQGFAGSFRGKGVATAPLRLWRVPLEGGEPAGYEVSGLPGGIIANPPIVDPDRRVAVGYDSGNGVMAAWRFGEPGDVEPAWRREQDHAGHMIRFPDTGELITGHFDHERGVDQCVVLDIATGDELARVDTGSPVQAFLFPCVGWDRDLYMVSIAGIARIAATG